MEFDADSDTCPLSAVLLFFANDQGADATWATSSPGPARGPADEISGHVAEVLEPRNRKDRLGVLNVFELNQRFNQRCDRLRVPMQRFFRRKARVGPFQTGFGSGLPMPSSARRGRRTASGRPRLGGAGTCLVTSTISTPPANRFDTERPIFSHMVLVFSQNGVSFGGWNKAPA